MTVINLPDWSVFVALGFVISVLIYWRLRRKPIQRMLIRARDPFGVFSVSYKPWGFVGWIDRTVGLRVSIKISLTRDEALRLANAPLDRDYAEYELLWDFEDRAYFDLEAACFGEIERMHEERLADPSRFKDVDLRRELRTRIESKLREYMQGTPVKLRKLNLEIWDVQLENWTPTLAI
jgi:hypothetical protein